MPPVPIAPHEPSTRSLDIAVFGGRSIPSTYSGYETFLTAFLPELVARGHRVTMYVRDRSGPMEPYRGVERVPLPSIPSKSLETISHGVLASAMVGRTRPDVALAVNLANVPMVYALQKAGIPTALNVDGQEWLRGKWSPQIRKVWHRAAQAADRAACAVITDCNGMGDVYRSEFGCDSTVIPYCWSSITDDMTDDGVSERLAALGLERNRFFVVAGRLNPENNIERTVNGFLASNREEQLVVLGAANYDSPTARMLSQVDGVSTRVRFLGHVADRQEFGALLRGSAGYIHGHSVGGINPSLIEAMGSGALCLCFGTPFNREAIGDAGLVFDDFDHELPELLDQLDIDDADALLLRKKAVARVDSEYSLDEVTDAYEKVLRAASDSDASDSVVVPTRWSQEWADAAPSPAAQVPSRPSRAVVIHPSDENYGADKILRLTIERMSAAGTLVRVLLPDDREPGPLTDALSAMDGVTVERPPALAVLRRARLAGSALPAYVRDLVRARRELGRIIENFDPDVLYINTLAPVAGFVAPGISRSKKIVHCHEIQRSALGRVLHSLAGLSCGEVLCVSDAVADSFSDRLPAKRTTIRNGIPAAPSSLDDAARRPRGDRLSVAFVGRLSEWKGLETVVHLAERSHALGIDLTVVGSPVPLDEYGLRIEKRLTELASKGLVEFRGFESDPLALMHAADLVLVPSTKPDPYPTVVLESLSVGTPVLTSLLGGAKEALDHGVEGWLVDEPTATSFEEAIRSIAAMSADELDDMRTAARKRFDHSHSIEGFHRRLDEALPLLMDPFGLAS